MGADYIEAPELDGYEFVCWAACATSGWVGGVYIETPTLRKAKTWVVSDPYNTGGKGRIDCIALYQRV